MGTSVADLAPGLSRKLKKVQESRIDTPYLLSSLNTLSSFYDDNTPQARRNLRSTIEKRALSINCEFLDASHAAQLALDSVENEVDSLAACCDRRRRIMQLGGNEINALREEELNENFFKALSHVQEIHANCKVLLRTHHQRAGLELMDMMAVYQEGAYERLCSELLKTAVRYLRERSVLFKYCAEEVANMRHNALFRRFISALTRGGPGGLPRPIEVHAHDPLRYVGDMLGWLHQALASERELVAVLLDPDTITDSGPKQFSNNSEDGSGKTESDLMFVLDRIFEGISDLLGRETALCNTLWALKDAAQNTFFDILKGRGEKLLRYPPLVAVDLSPPPAVTEGVSVLLEIIDNYNSMMVPASGQKPAFGPVISAILDPIVQMCEQAAEAHKSKGAGHSSRRSGMSFDCGQLTKSSVDAILSNSSSVSSSLIVGVQYSYKSFIRPIRPPTTKNLLMPFFFLGLTRIFGNQLLFLIGLSYTNPTYAAAIQPSIPNSKPKGILSLVVLKSLIGYAEFNHVTQNEISAKGQPEPSGWLIGGLQNLWFDHFHLGVLCLIGNCICMAAFLAIQPNFYVPFIREAGITDSKRSCLLGIILFT
ncbi:hypothetical protein JHK85_001946 [Glycine max]|nr:hypothetical protein JHK85_001946 [Glycine max]